MASTDVAVSTPRPAVKLAGSLERDALAATELARFVRDQGLSQTIQGREYMTSEAWSAAGRLLGLRVVCEDPKPFTGLENARGYSCRARLLDQAGVQIAEASSICLRGEKRWSSADEFAIYSMAQTRAVGKVHRVALSALAKLAGFEAAPAEEMPGDTAQVDPSLSHSTEALPRTRASRDEKREVGEALTAAGLTAAEGKLVLEDVAGCTKRDDLFSDQVQPVIAAILQEGERRRAEAAGLDDVQGVIDSVEADGQQEML